MSRHISTLNLHLEPADNQRLASLCGPFDDNVKQLERRLGVEISYRDNHFQLLGKQAQVEAPPSSSSTSMLKPSRSRVAR